VGGKGAAVFAFGSAETAPGCVPSLSTVPSSNVLCFAEGFLRAMVFLVRVENVESSTVTKNLPRSPQPVTLQDEFQ
jgi:hypothetical protein